MGSSPQPLPEEKRVVPEVPPEGLGSDVNARLEAAAIAQGKLNQFRRDDQIQTHIHRATICFVWVFAGVLTLMAAVWLYHLITPASWGFLTPAQRGELNTALMSAIGSSLVTDRLRKILK